MPRRRRKESPVRVERGKTDGGEQRMVFEKRPSSVDIRAKPAATRKVRTRIGEVGRRGKNRGRSPEGRKEAPKRQVEGGPGKRGRENRPEPQGEPKPRPIVRKQNGRTRYRKGWRSPSPPFPQGRKECLLSIPRFGLVEAFLGLEASRPSPWVRPSPAHIFVGIPYPEIRHECLHRLPRGYFSLSAFRRRECREIRRKMRGYASASARAEKTQASSSPRSPTMTR